jgi:UDP-N-acetylmuramoyl-L-alanyl-D-glutamate--2,6-diaminopimelate ligase
MKLLKELLKRTEVVEVYGSTEVPVTVVHFDSRQIRRDGVFVATRGSTLDGHSFINKAIESGARAIICEEYPESLKVEVTYVKVKNSSAALGQMAAAYHNHPSEKLKLIGITGTNGKTTTATLLFHLFKSLNYKVGLISTVNVLINDRIIPTTHTTPDALRLNELLHLMTQEECAYCFMEVSSHAIAQGRISGLRFSGGIFTNLTHEHLDYHRTMEVYCQVKKSYFDGLGSEAFALSNTDDEYGLKMLEGTSARKKTYGLNSAADFKGRLKSYDFSGLTLAVNGRELSSKLVGRFNAYNILAVYAASSLLGAGEERVAGVLKNLSPVEGRFEQLQAKRGVTVIIDFAHTPDALHNVLSTINHLKESRQKIITILGCSGNRDKDKRPIMARIACDLSGAVILTSNSPRAEEPLAIIADMARGISPPDLAKTYSIVDRREALEKACRVAAPGDIILVVGKGHERYEEINDVKYPFDDREIIREYL